MGDRVINMISNSVDLPESVFSLQIRVLCSSSLLVSKELLKDEEGPFMFLFRTVFSAQRYFFSAPCGSNCFSLCFSDLCSLAHNSRCMLSGL